MRSNGGATSGPTLSTLAEYAAVHMHIHIYTYNIIVEFFLLFFSAFCTSFLTLIIFKIGTIRLVGPVRLRMGNNLV